MRQRPNVLTDVWPLAQSGFQFICESCNISYSLCSRLAPIIYHQQSPSYISNDITSLNSRTSGRCSSTPRNKNIVRESSISFACLTIWTALPKAVRPQLTLWASRGFIKMYFTLLFQIPYWQQNCVVCLTNVAFHFCCLNKDVTKNMTEGRAEAYQRFFSLLSLKRGSGVVV